METSESFPGREGGSSILEDFPTEDLPSSWAKGPVILRLTVWNQDSSNLKTIFSKLKFLSPELSFNAHLCTFKKPHGE